MSMLPRAANRRLFSLSSPRALAFGLLAIVVISLFAMMPLFAQAIAHIRGVHVTTTSQMHMNGKVMSQKTDTWFKLPDRVRNENSYILVINNGSSVWQYDKKRNVYSVTSIPNHNGHLGSEKQFTVDEQLKGLQFMGGKVTQKEIKAVYKKQPCTAIDVTVQPAAPIKGKPSMPFGPSEHVYYLLPKSRLIRAETSTMWAPGGKTIIASTVSDYDYSDVRPDKFFTFVPPAGAKKVDSVFGQGQFPHQGMHGMGHGAGKR